MTDTINSLSLTPSSVGVTFWFTPSVPYTYLAPNGITISGSAAFIDTPTTFIATATINNQGNDLTGPLSIVEYRWDFGDGIIGYGNPVYHTYAITNVQARATLRVTDSKGRQWFTYAQMYLQSGQPPRTASLPLLLNSVVITS